MMMNWFRRQARNGPDECCIALILALLLAIFVSVLGVEAPWDPALGPGGSLVAVGGIVHFRRADPAGGGGTTARDGHGAHRRPPGTEDTVEIARPGVAEVPDLLVTLHLDITRGGLAGRAFFGHFACRKRDLVARMRVHRGVYVAPVTTLHLAIGARLYGAQDFGGFAGSQGLELIRLRSGGLQMAGRTRDRRLALLPRDEGTAVLIFDPEGNITSTGKAHITISTLVAEPQPV